MILAQDAESFTFTWTVKRDGAVVNLTGFTVTIDARDKKATPGTLRISAGSCSVPTPSNGQVLYTFSAANLSITESTDGGTHIEGEYRLKFVSGSTVWKSPRGAYRIDRDPMIAAT